MAYQLTANPDLVIRLEDGATVPRLHRFWDEYEAWLAQGNAPVAYQRPVDTLAERQWRDAQINRLRWLRERHLDEREAGRATTLTAEMNAELLDYLQALRDWPQSQVYPDGQQRPAEPQWLATQLRESGHDADR